MRSAPCWCWVVLSGFESPWPKEAFHIGSSLVRGRTTSAQDFFARHCNDRRADEVLGLLAGAARGGRPVSCSRSWLRLGYKLIQYMDNGLGAIHAAIYHLYFALVL